MTYLARERVRCGTIRCPCFCRGPFPISRALRPSDGLPLCAQNFRRTNAPPDAAADGHSDYPEQAEQVRTESWAVHASRRICGNAACVPIPKVPERACRRQRQRNRKIQKLIAERRPITKALGIGSKPATEL